MELKGGTRRNGFAILVTSLPFANSQKPDPVQAGKRPELTFNNLHFFYLC